MLQLSERNVGSILLVANNCGNVHVRFSTFFYFRKRRKNKKNAKNAKKRDTNKKRKKTFFCTFMGLGSGLGLYAGVSGTLSVCRKMPTVRQSGSSGGRINLGEVCEATLSRLARVSRTLSTSCPTVPSVPPCHRDADWPYIYCIFQVEMRLSCNLPHDMALQ